MANGSSVIPDDDVYLTLQGVESERCTGFTTSLDGGKPCYCKSASSLADGLAVPVPGVNAFATAKPLIDKMVVVRCDIFFVQLMSMPM